MDNKEIVILAGKKTTGGSVTPESIVTATGQMTEAQTDRMRANIVAAQDALRLTATPTSGPSGNTIMSGTWSGATWDEVVNAVLATRLIRIDITGVATVTLLYNAGSSTHIASNNFVYTVNGTDYIVFIVLSYSGGSGNQIRLLVAHDKPITDTILTTEPIITPVTNTIYNCGELTSLTITNSPATGKFWIWFTSGATATVITGIDNFTPEANKVYRIFVENGYATYDSWSVGGGT